MQFGHAFNAYFPHVPQTLDDREIQMNSHLNESMLKFYSNNN